MLCPTEQCAVVRVGMTALWPCAVDGSAFLVRRTEFYALDQILLFRDAQFASRQVQGMPAAKQGGSNGRPLRDLSSATP